MHIDAAETSEMAAESTEIDRSTQSKTVTGMRNAVLDQVDRAVPDEAIRRIFEEYAGNKNQDRRQQLKYIQVFIGTGSFRRRFNGLGIEVGGAKANFDPDAIFRGDGI